MDMLCCELIASGFNECMVQWLLVTWAHLPCQRHGQTA